MRYIDINPSRLTNILDTLCAAHSKISKQGRLGIDNNGKCCNHIHTTSGESIGCLVGCLVGPTNFGLENSTTAMDLDDAKLALAFKNGTGGNWSHLSAEDKACYQRLLASLQTMHDSSPSFGFTGTEFVLFMLRVLINRLQDIESRMNYNLHDEVKCIDLAMTVGNSTANSLYLRITTDIDRYIAKK